MAAPVQRYSSTVSLDASPRTPWSAWPKMVGSFLTIGLAAMTCVPKTLLSSAI